MIEHSAFFFIPSGVAAQCFFPGAFLDGVGGTEAWLASGTITSITTSAEVLAAPGFSLRVFDHKSSEYLNNVRPGGNQLMLRAVTGLGTMHPSASGGMDCYGTDGIASFNTNNMLAIIRCESAETRTYPIKVPNLLGMCVVFNGGANTTKQHAVTINYIPFKLGGQRKRFHDTYRTVINAGPAWS